MVLVGYRNRHDTTGVRDGFHEQHVCLHGDVWAVRILLCHVSFNLRVYIRLRGEEAESTWYVNN